MSNVRKPHDLELVLAAARVVEKYVSHNSLAHTAVPDMIGDVHQRLVELSGEDPGTGQAWGRVDRKASPPVLGRGSSATAGRLPAARDVTNIAAITASPSPVKATREANQADGTPRTSEDEFRSEFVISQGEQDPAVPVALSVWSDRIVCLECGRSLATLKRHLKSTHGLGDTAYRKRFGLSAHYPMSCSAYREDRRKHIEGGPFRPLTREERAKRKTPA